jgi:protein-tyrosine kinase
MSTIYKALEKAEKERGSKQDVILIPETKEEDEKVSREIGFDLPTGMGKESDQKLVSLFQPGSLASEQFRKLRTYVFRLKTSESMKTNMVTSATSGEGKSFVASNLAVGIANDLHAHALLVDCDLRRPTITEWFGIKNGRGLSDYLKGDGDLSELFNKTEIQKLTILSAGGIQENPAELFGSNKMGTLIKELKSRYHDRFIIFDSTPILATTEPQILAKLVDGIIFVVRAGVTPRETVKQALDSLDKDKIFGFVLNHLRFRSSGLHSQYFGSDGYYYRYGYGKSKPKFRKRFFEIFRSKN